MTEKAPLEEVKSALLSHLPIFIFIATTDAGPDQDAAKNMIAKEISPVLCLLFFSVNCHEHQACDTLCSEAEVETVLYFLFPGNDNKHLFSIRAIFMKWTELRGPASSMLHASKQPPKCLSERWCSKETAHKRTRSFDALDVEGELDATSYREKVTRSKRESLLAISHPVWQTMVAESYNVREPLRHFHRFLMEVPRDSCKVWKLARLVWGKASCIASEFDALLDAGAWIEQVRVLPASESCCILWLLLSNAANFDRRMVQMTRAFPMRLHWLARARPSTPCLQRQRVADELINTSPDLLQDTALKNRILFYDQLVSTQSTGRVSVGLFALFFQVACHLHADTREIEAVNNFIKHQVERASFRGSLNPISDRMLNTKAVHFGESSSPKWSELEPHVAGARAEAMHVFPITRKTVKSRAASHQFPCVLGAHPARGNRRHAQARQLSEPPEPTTCRRIPGTL